LSLNNIGDEGGVAISKFLSVGSDILSYSIHIWTRIIMFYFISTCREITSNPSGGRRLRMR